MCKSMCLWQIYLGDFPVANGYGQYYSEISRDFSKVDLVGCCVKEGVFFIYLNEEMILMISLSFFSVFCIPKKWWRTMEPDSTRK